MTGTFDVTVRPAGPLAGEYRVPGDKSISHRAAIFGALARGRTRITNYATSRDCASTLSCLAALGVEVGRDGSDVTVEGGGPASLTTPAGGLDAGNSGTTMRLLAGALAGCPVAAEITGDESLRRRPMERVARPLREMGADVTTVAGLPPITVRGGAKLTAITYAPEPPSAQVKSAILLAGLAAEGVTSVREAVRTRDHTERLLPAFGAAAGSDAGGAWVEGPVTLEAAELEVPGDMSSAAFLFCLALLVPGSDVTVRGVGLNPTRTRLLDVLADLGAAVEVVAARGGGPEPIGDVRVRYAERLGAVGGLVLEADAVAELIDEVPILAVLGTRIDGGIRVTGAADLRRKESDRLAALAVNLRRMGATVAEAEDGISVAGPCRLKGARVDAFGDHRIAMAFACAGLAADGETVVESADVVGVSFPEFFDLLPPGSVTAGADGGSPR
jgi:3-phosphoshikimate 1-carboxyvinyltransferase